MKSKTLVSLVMSAFLSFAPVANAGQEAVKKEMVATDLTGTVYKLTKKEGLRQLSNLAAKGGKEDGWYFLPEKGIWVDHGYGIKHEGYYVEKDVILNKGVTEAIDVHIHPVPNPSFGVPKWSGNLKIIEIQRPIKLRVRGLLPPSDADIIHLLTNMEYFENRGIKLEEAWIVDCKGYWSVNLKNSRHLNRSIEDFSERYKNLLQVHLEDYIMMYSLNKDKGPFEPIEKWFIETFEREALRLGLDVTYYRLD